MAKKITKDKLLKFCPNCQSINVSMDTSNPLVGAYGVPANYVCEDCKYSNKIFPEVSTSELEGLKKLKTKTKIEKSDLVDTSYGDFVVKKWWKFMGPMSIILGIVLLSFWLFSPNTNLDSIFLIILIAALVLGFITTYFAYFKKLRKNK